MKRDRIRPGNLPARYTVFFDGCCEPKNPGGTAGYGYAVFENMHRQAVAPRQPIHTHSGYIEASPTTSNNVAEFLAVRHALGWFATRGDLGQSIHFFGDSMLVICILWGDPRRDRKRWRITGVDHKVGQEPGRYAEHAVWCRGAIADMPRCQGFWLPREENGLADELSKAELRTLGVEFRIQPEDQNGTAEK